MEYFFLGLGNPVGFEGTRHNVGKDLITSIVNQSGGEWKKIGVGRVSFVKIGEHRVVCAVSDGFMNDTGSDLKHLLDEINTDRLVVFHDDVDFPVGEIRFSKGKSAGGHNGVDSVIERIKTKDFFRFRIGVGKGEDQKKYVLEKIPKGELKIIHSSLDKKMVEMMKVLFSEI